MALNRRRWVMFGRALAGGWDFVNCRTIVWLTVALAGTGALAEEEQAADGNAELAELLASARQYEIRMTRPEAVQELREPSLLNFTNPERNQERGSVFVWMHNDR